MRESATGARAGAAVMAEVAAASTVVDAPVLAEGMFRT
jgi:hypothetical protein